jgi:glycine cleavage system regulatory protein
MRKQPQEPVIYTHQKLMNDLNEMMIRIKHHLFNIPGTNQMFEVQINMSLPSNQELDDITNKLMKVLREDKKPVRKYKRGNFQEK